MKIHLMLLTVGMLGTLTGFAIVGAEAVFLRTLPSSGHLLFAVGVGVASALAGVGARKAFAHRRVSPE
jgi:hypothetical protein